MHKAAAVITLFMFVVICFTGQARAESRARELEERIARGPAFVDLVDYALEVNPEIRAARAAWRMQIEKYRLATAYPDPQLMITYFPEPIETRLGPQDWNAQLSQTIPFPGRLGKQGSMASTDADIARLNLDRAVRDTVVQLRISFEELLYIHRALAIARENGRLLDHIRRTGETAYGEERGTLYDVTKAQSQTAQLEYDILLLTELAATEEMKLNALLNRPPESAIGPLSREEILPLAYSLEEIYQLAHEHREEIEIARQEVSRAEVNRGLERSRTLPDFKVGLFYAGIGEPEVASPPRDAGRDAVGIQAGISIPLWFGKNSGRLEQARVNLEKAREMEKSAVNTTRATVRELYFRLTNARRLIDLYTDTLLPQAHRSLQAAETWFREGEGSYADFLEIQATLYNFQLSLARARADYGKYLARLEGAAGIRLTRSGGERGEEVEP